MEQQIRFCTTSDGASIAYATVGSGPPLVYTCGWPGHLAVEWETPVARDFIESFASAFTVIRYDMRNSGLSETAGDDMSLPALVRDLEAVVDDVGLDAFPLMSLGLLAGPIAMTYAAMHPERVSRLVLNGAYLRGDRLLTEEQFRAMRDWVAAFGQLMLPDRQGQRFEPDPEKLKQATGVHDAGSRPEVIARLLDTMFHTDLTDAMERLSMPALVLHGSEDERVSLAVAREVAARLPRVRFVPYEGTGDTPWADAAIILPEIFEFLGAAPPQPAAAPAAPAPRGSMMTVLFTDIDSSTALTQRLGDAKAQELVRAHDRIVRDALAAHGGTEIKHTGDGIMASFPTASGAVECAIAIQRAVAARDDELSVHAGLNAGEPVAEESDLFGTAVQLARRICDHADGGEILVADVVRQLAAGKGFLFADRGEVLPKGFEEPVRLYEARWREEA